MKLTEMKRFKHDMKTYLNHIMGFSEILLEDASELGQESFIARLEEISLIIGDLRNYCLGLFRSSEFPKDFNAFREGALAKIAAVTSSFQEMHSLCIKNKDDDCFLSDIDNILDSLGKLKELIGDLEQFAAPHEEKAVHETSGRTKKVLHGRILIIDDNVINRKLLQRKLERLGHSTQSAASGEVGLELLREEAFDLVILDLMMPGLSGFDVLKQIKTDPEIRLIPVIMNSAYDEMESIVKCIQMGAEDYLPKDVNPVLLKARIEACLEKKLFRQQEYLYMKTLIDGQDILARELGEAADYVLSLIPADDKNSHYDAQSLFHPSAQLGGDCLDHIRLDENTSLFYLLDVSGHGIGAALLSVSVMNVLRSGTLPGTDFKKPEEVLLSLNNVFKMEDQNNMFFSIWYGVYDYKEHRLSFSSAGSPPGFLKMSNGHIIPLDTGNIIIGADERAVYQADEVVISPGNALYLFSDGVFEVPLVGQEDVLGIERFQHFLEEFDENRGLDELVGEISELSGGKGFDDDITLLRVLFE